MAISAALNPRDFVGPSRKESDIPDLGEDETVPRSPERPPFRAVSRTAPLTKKRVNRKRELSVNSCSSKIM
jgi:hypothetical protein